MSKRSKDKQNKLLQTNIPEVSAALKPLEVKTVLPQMTEIFKTLDIQSQINIPSVFTDLEASQARIQSVFEPFEASQARIQSVFTDLEASQARIQSVFEPFEASQERIQSILEVSQARIQSVFEPFEASQARIQSVFTDLEASQARIQSIFEPFEASQERIQSVLAVLEVSQASVLKNIDGLDISLQPSWESIPQILTDLEEPTELQTNIPQMYLDLEETIELKGYIPESSKDPDDALMERWQQDILQRLENLEETMKLWQQDISEKLEKLEDLTQKLLLLFQRKNDADEGKNMTVYISVIGDTAYEFPVKYPIDAKEPAEIKFAGYKYNVLVSYDEVGDVILYRTHGGRFVDPHTRRVLGPQPPTDVNWIVRPALIEQNKKWIEENSTYKLTHPNPKIRERNHNFILDYLAELVSSEVFIFCEGEGFDETCYHAIFSSHHPEVRFISIGGKNTVENVVKSLKGKMAKGTKVIGVVDRDRRTLQGIKRKAKEGIRTLKYGEIEDYLLHNDVLTEMCVSIGKSGKVKGFLDATDKEIEKVNNDDKIHDKRRPIVQRIQQQAEIILELSHSGDTVENFMTDILAPLIKPGMAVYEQLHDDIFGE